MFRNSAKAFATDPIAQKIVLDAVKNEEIWNKYKTAEKYFLLLPLMHAEDPNLTKMQVDEYTKLEKRVEAMDPDRHGAGGVGQFLRGVIGFATDHDATIQ